MKRHIFNTGAIGSLLLFVTAAVLWALAPWEGTEVELPGEARVSLVGSWFRVSTVQKPFLLTPANYPDPRIYSSWRFAGIFGDRFWSGPHKGSTVMVPLAYLAVLFIVLPITWTARRLRERRRAAIAHMTCSACGYDLRGSRVEACPECGARRPAAT